MTVGLTRAGFDNDLRKMQLHETSFGFLLMSRGVYLIENKRDFGTVRTGNLFVEYRQPSGASGIATTTAHHWAFEYDDDCWIVVPTERLKRYCRAAYRHKALRKAGGDYNRYQGVLLPIRWLIPPYLEGTL